MHLQELKQKLVDVMLDIISLFSSVVCYGKQFYLRRAVMANFEYVLTLSMLFKKRH
jgi:hypothetical protein